MLANGLKNDGSDKCVHIKIIKVIVCLYIGDMLIINRDINDINATKRML